MNNCCPSLENYPAPEPDEVEQAIEELIAEFGLRGVLSAFLKSSMGDEIDKVGGGATREVVQVILREIVFAPDPRLEAEVMAIGAGIFLQDDATMTRIATKYAITKQALSKRVLKFNDEHNLRPSAFMRSDRDRDTYAQTNRPKQAA